MLGFRRDLFGFLPLIAIAALACGGESLTVPPTTGTLQVTTSTGGAEPDPDGYVVQVDGGPEQTIGASGTLQLVNVEAGSHLVQLSGVAANCTVGGDNPRTVGLTGGETQSVAFEVTCTATSGDLQVSAATGGASPDADGYNVTVDGIDRGAMPATGSLAVAAVSPGDHLVGLSGVAGNCQVQGDNPRTAAVTTGSSTAVAFVITCTTPPSNVGSLRITTATTGGDQDPNGYSFAVDGGAPQPIAISTSTTVSQVGVGPHSVGLSGVAANCTVQGTNPRAVTVASGVTAEVSFTVTCAATTGSIKVTTATTGTNPDDNYSVSVDGGTATAIGGNTSVTLNGIAAGARSVTLSGVAGNCTVGGANPQPVTVTAGQTATAAFTITCTGPAPARIAFVRGDGSTVGDVFTVNPDGSGRSRLTDGRTGFADSPQWSPDHTKIVFEGGPSAGDIYVINADGSGLTNLTNTPAGTVDETGPKWSPDGSRIVFTKTTTTHNDPGPDTHATDLYTMSANGSGPVQITNTGTEGIGTGYTWSPNGSLIAFESVRGNPAHQGVYVVSSSGGGATRLSGDGVDSWDPDWSADGRKIAYLSQAPGGQIQVWTMSSNGTGQTAITDQSGDKADPSWSPDGSKIVYTYSPAFRTSEIWTVNATGGVPFKVTKSGSDNTSPVWSPDGSQIAFVTGFGISADAAAVNVVNADGTGQKNVSTLAGFRPDW